MVKIGVFSDTHVGRTIPKTVGELRQQAFRHAFSQAINILIQEKVDYVINAGDVFEKRSMNPGDSIFVKEELQRLVNGLCGKVKILIVRGNHDGTMGNSALDYIEHPLAKYLEILGDETSQDKPRTFEDDNIGVIGFAYTPYTSIKLETAKQSLKESFAALKAPHKLFIMHAFIDEHQDIPPGVPDHQIVKMGLLKELGANLVISGHCHTYTPLATIDGVALLSPGATEAIEFSDESLHGVSIIKLGQTVKCDFKPITPLYKMKNVVVDGGESLRPAEWFQEHVLQDVKDFIELLQKERNKGLLRIVLEGIVEQDKYELEELLELRINELKGQAPHLLYAAIENRLKQRGVMIDSGVSTREEFLAEALSSLDQGIIADAMSLVEEVGMTLDEEASSKTGLLTDARRNDFINKWLTILGAGDEKNAGTT
jgi:DNA repair exonuclease SbcCD nuclease subunit